MVGFDITFMDGWCGTVHWSRVPMTGDSLWVDKDLQSFGPGMKDRTGKPRLPRILLREIVGIGALCAVAFGQVAQAQNRLIHRSGQTVTPSFDGWYRNPDGTFSLVFGYYNRNTEQELDVTIGPDNRFEPGLPDQGQPTHFLPQRQVGIFAAIVPADFGAQTLTWHLTTAGQALTIPGYLKPDWEIDALKDATSGATPPKVVLNPSTQVAQGPRGATATTEAERGKPVTLSLVVSNVGAVPREEGSRGARTGPLPISWSKFRGPASIQMSNVRGTPDPSGNASVTVSFTEPGEYTVRVLAGRATTEGCCWTNGFFRVRVKPSGQ
jgi:hypothetical protein